MIDDADADADVDDVDGADGADGAIDDDDDDDGDTSRPEEEPIKLLLSLDDSITIGPDDEDGVIVDELDSCCWAMQTHAEATMAAMKT